MMLIIFTAISQYSAFNPISNTINYIEELPPISNPYKTVILEPGNQLNTLLEIANKSSEFNFIYNSLEDGNASNISNVVLIFNPYELINAIEKLNNKDVSSFYTWLGTNDYGIDIWARLWSSLSITLTLIFLAFIFRILLGWLIGYYASFFNSKFAAFIKKIIISITIVPEFIWYLLLIFIFQFSTSAIFGALILSGWIYQAKSTFIIVDINKNKEFISASKSLGTSNWKIFYLHFFAIILQDFLATFVEKFAIILTMLTIVGYLNLNAQQSDINIGNIFSEAINLSKTNYSYLLSLTLFLIIFLCNFKVIISQFLKSF
ncbi:ABC transporter permease subunit [Mycoplasma iguanae]|uniref:ABC transporter permease subunit n=1 Tax=Mycoplasma iguanae TaxID=292461 RepID=A0ABY5R7M0_9MOLU|nr:ABC transporter permease subunit [Mycoplasma iguanae]UVD81503.1 ABC transporter permease subunit [Mycoplasma iguanae]